MNLFSVIYSMFGMPTPLWFPAFYPISHPQVHPSRKTGVAKVRRQARKARRAQKSC